MSRVSRDTTQPAAMITQRSAKELHDVNSGYDIIDAVMLFEIRNIFYQRKRLLQTSNIYFNIFFTTWLSS